MNGHIGSEDIHQDQRPGLLGQDGGRDTWPAVLPQGTPRDSLSTGRRSILPRSPDHQRTYNATAGDGKNAAKTGRQFQLKSRAADIWPDTKWVIMVTSLNEGAA